MLEKLKKIFSKKAKKEIDPIVKEIDPAVDFQKVYFNKCATCKFYAQGSAASFCAHEKATENEKGYRYYNFNCDSDGPNKWEKGSHQTRIDYTNDPVGFMSKFKKQ